MLGNLLQPRSELQIGGSKSRKKEKENDAAWKGEKRRASNVPIALSKNFRQRSLSIKQLHYKNLGGQ
jgi:hypothetical protein